MAKTRERWYRYKLVFASDIEPLMVEDVAQASRVLRELYPSEKNVTIVPIDPICMKGIHRCQNNPPAITSTSSSSSPKE